MPENTSENKQWLDPKDYGLPYVEIAPLDSGDSKESVSEKIQQSEEPIELKEKEVGKQVENEKEVESILEAKNDNSPHQENKIVPAKALEKVETQTSSSNSKAISSINASEKKKNNSWVPIVLILAVVVISVIVWQLLGQENDTQTLENQLTQQEIQAVENTSVQPIVENTQSEETQSTENQDSISNSNSSLEEPVETPQTGTTIDRTGAETLIRVEGRSERPQYFIVVGSLPNERMAISESEQYLDRVSSIYMILPYEDVRNYRLAIGSFTSFRKASEELEAIKDQYTEALWILKY
ncbi:hypothetical protein [Algoriphagus sp.]|uniref:hypothetical protein n=1 Tax=Algoriphagus sp. TaxID=1872435 RepID=UPI0025EC34FE|nr:hypothetical protein [Algoriphagus sp.]